MTQVDVSCKAMRCVDSKTSTTHLSCVDLLQSCVLHVSDSLLSELSLAGAALRCASFYSAALRFAELADRLH